MMKKLLLAVGMSALVLSACGTQQDEKTVSGNEDEVNEADKKKHTDKGKDQHKVTQKDGVTYVDGHVIANKKVNLPKDYAPGENAEARAQLDRMIQDANEQGVQLVYRSGYRSYDTQVQLYNSYVARDGEAAANKYSAKPGYSEHQTGLAFDVGSVNASDDFKTSFENTKEGQWVQQHAHEYGFIIRYLEGKEAITGYQYEPWHLRYVGKDLAEKIHEQGITLEEYFDYGK
ncbi:D-alanyl-D-alanine carboxypeptidase [Staphylococcus microti]|uniref:D-alanyl-D-alanine carboxypeptidase n=2 Tax=Staphylococcus microti TaxID=569857 RepID=A0A380GU40_9STAP|nr:D-alanyl-D-alanine carboxypeptidase [Staphylococcus microti]